MPYYNTNGQLWWIHDQTTSTLTSPSLISQHQVTNTSIYYYPTTLGTYGGIGNLQGLQPITLVQARMQQYQNALAQQQNAMLQAQNQYQNPYNYRNLPRTPWTPAAPAIIHRHPDRIREIEEGHRRASEENRRHAEAHAVQRRQADQRALELLKSYLTAEQLAMLDREGWFIVIGQSGRHYRIKTESVAGNIEVFHANDNRIIHRLCCHMDYGIPTADHFLAQKIMLESAEDDFLRIANQH